MPNISRSKSNQTMKFGQLIECNMRILGITFQEKLYPRCGGEISARPFSVKLKYSIWMNSLKFYTVCFYCIPNWGLSKYIETKLQTTCFYLILSIFKKWKIKRGLKLVSLRHFLHNFWGKIFLKKKFFFYQLTKFHFLVVFTSWDIRQYVYYKCLLTRLWRH